MGARLMLQGLTFALCAIVVAGVCHRGRPFSLIFVWWRDLPLPSPLDTRERVADGAGKVHARWHPGKAFGCY